MKCLRRGSLIYDGRPEKNGKDLLSVWRVNTKSIIDEPIKSCMILELISDSEAKNAINSVGE